jgi:outer membrane protein OmpA-like peptidoglycan-associated protein
MKFFFLLVLVLAKGILALQAQPVTYTDPHNYHQLSYPPSWQLRKGEGAEVSFAPPGSPRPATVTLTRQALPEARKNLPLTAPGEQDSLWQHIQRQPQAQLISLEQHDYGRYEEQRYDYTFAAAAGRIHVLGRRLWRAGYELVVEYRAASSQDGRYLAQGRQVVESFAFTNTRMPSRRYSDQVCNDKMYGIAAYYRAGNGQLLDDCRTIHEFSTLDSDSRPLAHRRVLPFQSYALALGFDNCLYSVTKAPTDSPELVYRYNPSTRQGGYTSWQLPAQGPENSWISAATDEQGSLLFITTDANQLVKVNPTDGRVTTLWRSDPVRQAPYYPAIGFDRSGTHANFCLDDANTMYLVYSTDGSLLKVDLNTQQPSPELMALSGLPRRGGYSDLLMQNDQRGRRRMYMAGPKSVYKVDLARHQASFVRKGVYTDLAGCNLFSIPPRSRPAPPPPATATWQGRVLDAVTYQPLPQAQLRLGLAGADSALALSAGGAFAFAATPGQTYHYRVRLAGYLATDSSWTAPPGAMVRDVLLRPLRVGTTLKLANVQFEQGQAVLLPSSFPALNKLRGWLADNPRMTIELHGHTDNVGPPEKNMQLSEQRVAAVKAYLVGRGIAEGRITGVGFGGTQPAASNGQEATRRLNRRVEFRVTGME